MAITYTYFEQDNAVDSWIVEETDGEGTIVSKYVVYVDPNVKPDIRNIKKISAESADFSGSLLVTGSVTATTGFIGSLQGTATTASFVQNAISSSFASTASFATTASRAVSSSFATTASYATVAQNVLNESSFALLGSPNIFTSNQTITAKLSQGNSTTVGTTKAYSAI